MMHMNEAAEVQPHAEWAHEEVERRRLIAYANPSTGSDRFFAEANRLEAQGMPVEAAAARAAGVTRYEEIKSKHPWPNNEELDDETITRNQE